MAVAQRPGMGLNVQAINANLIRKAIPAVDEVAQSVHMRARKYAPVRKLFRGTTYRKDDSLFGQFASPKGKARRPIERRINFGGQQRSGHANSFRPLFRSPDGTRAIQGDFRRVHTSDTGAQRLRPIFHDDLTEGNKVLRGNLEVFQRTGATGYRQIRQSKPISAEDIHVRGGKALTGRGRYEVRTGRSVRTSPSGISRIGGRLRGEIYVESARYSEGRVTAYVVSPTKDPETGYPYNRAMEFGTAHNRPYPFMRPALREHRTKFRQAIKSALGTRQR